MCGLCKMNFGRYGCTNCGDSFCEKCFTKLHSNGQSIYHKKVSILGECPTNWVDEGFCSQCKRAPVSYVCMKPLHVSLCMRKVCCICTLNPVPIWKDHKCVFQYIKGSLDLEKPKS